VRRGEGEPLERVGANEFGEAVGLVGRGFDHRAHFMEHDVTAGVGELQGGFAAGEPRANHVNFGHPGKSSDFPSRSRSRHR
jgi:hypothetical protein